MLDLFTLKENNKKGNSISMVDREKKTLKHFPSPVRE